MKPAQLIAVSLVGGPEPDLLDHAARQACVHRAHVPTRELVVCSPAPAQEPNQPPSAFVTTMNAVRARPPAMRDPILLEALELLAEAGLVLPTRLIVPLLEIAEGNRHIAARLPSVLGSRGRWLVGLGEAWLRGRAVTEPEPSDWDEGGLPERLAWLRHLRAADAAAGRELVEQTRKEKAADRAQIIAALEVGLGPDDEELLERFLKDRSKTVAGVAAGLLARLDGSAYLARAVGLARAAFTRAEKPRKGLLGKLRAPKRSIVAVAPPEKELAADLHAVVASISGVKGPAGRVQHLVAVIPPKCWAELGFSVRELAPGVLLDDEPVPLFPALTSAVLRWGDADAARELLGEHPEPALALLLPPTTRDAFLADAIRDTAPRQFPDLCHRLQQQDGLRLGPGTAGAVLDGILACVKAKAGVHQAATQLLAFSTDPRDIPELLPRITALNGDPDIPQPGRRAVRDAVAALTLRQSIHESIAHTKEPR